MVVSERAVIISLLPLVLSALGPIHRRHSHYRHRHCHCQFVRSPPGLESPEVQRPRPIVLPLLNHSRSASFTLFFSLSLLLPRLASLSFYLLPRTLIQPQSRSLLGHSIDRLIVLRFRPHVSAPYSSVRSPTSPVSVRLVREICPLLQTFLCHPSLRLSLCVGQFIVPPPRPFSALARL
ncbi:hypothetical protein BDV09DRAFT_92382 [Aspergillus tetrazonus]